MQPLPILLLGAGERGRALGQAWRKVPAVEILEVVDVDQARAESLAAELGAARVSTDFAKAIENTAANVVTVATPACFHKDAAVLAAARGRHIFSEKPIALTLDEADAVLEAVARSGVKYSVCHQRRLGKSFQKVQELLADGAIGRPVLYRGNFSMGIRPKVLMHDRRGNGGPVIDFCCHWFDLWRWYFGSEPANVTGRGFVLARDKPELSMIQEFAIDTASFVVEYQSGDVAGVNISWGTPPNIGAANLEDFIGPLGVLQATGQKVTIITRGGETVYEGLQTDLDAAIVHDFAQAIREDREPAVTGADAREALRGSLAVLESIEKRTTVVW